MKKRALRKEFFMEIRKSLPRFLSILFIVALGTAFYSGIQSSSPDMRYSGDAYFDAKELSDIQVTGTMGVTGDDVEALQNLKHIETAEGVCLKDVLTGEEGQRKVLRILSIPEKSNLVTVEEGEYPTKEDECLMDVQYAEHNGYQIGDTFRISEELEKDEDATLKSDTFTITGLCSSPLYISFSRGSTNVGNGEIAGFVYVPQETFTTDYYMQIYLKVKGAKELTAYTDAYDTTVAQAKEQVESIEKERCTRRQEEIKDEAQEKVSDARKELADKKAEADQKLADAKKEIDDAKKKLMQNFCIAYRGILCKNDLYATGTTGRLIEEVTNINIHKYLAGHLGGVQQLGAQISANEIDLVIFLRDPLAPKAHEPDVSNVMRLCDMHNISLATNLASAELLIKSLDRGDLEWREMYK